MTDIDETIDDVREAAADFLNAGERSPGHVALGVAVTIGFALLASGLATANGRPQRAAIQQRHADALGLALELTP